MTFQLFFSVHGTGSSPTGPDPENRVGDQDTGSPGRPLSSGLQVPGGIFPIHTCIRLWEAEPYLRTNREACSKMC